MRWLLIFWVGTEVLGTGQPFRKPLSTGCQAMCDEIRSCAKGVSRSEYSDMLCYLARCETGDKCRSEIRSPSGKFRGPFQFSKQTWRSVCRPLFKKRGNKDCLTASSIQDPCCSTQCAAEIVATKANGGLRNWPHCGPIAREAASAKGH